jgi:hemerythrin-like domain-containing protein
MDTLFTRLEQEHRMILEALQAFESYLSRALHRSVDEHDLARFVLFFRGYVDGIHHEREETLLLPALVRHDYGAASGPLAHVREQHRREHHLLQNLVSLAFRRGGCPASSPELQACGRSYVDFERGHLQREDTLLYPVAKLLLRREEARLTRESARFDADHDASGQCAWLERLLGDLRDVYTWTKPQLEVDRAPSVVG